MAEIGVETGEVRTEGNGVFEVPFTITLTRPDGVSESRASTATLVYDQVRERWGRLSAAHPQHWIGWDFAFALEDVLGPPVPRWTRR